MKLNMYTPSHDPNAGLLDIVLCWCFYVIGTVMHEVILYPTVTFFLQNTSFIIGILLGLMGIMKHLGIDLNLRRRFKNKK
jgi:hypothetical protein